MASVNKVIIVGNLGQNPETRTFGNGGMIATISVATTEKWTDKQTGEQKERTEWHRIVFNNRLAEIAAQYLQKGASVYVEGSLRTRKWTDGQGVERYSTEIRAERLQILGARQAQNQSQQGYEQAPQGQQTKPNLPQGMAHSKYQPMGHARPTEPAVNVSDDDMPF